MLHYKLTLVSLVALAGYVVFNQNFVNVGTKKIENISSDGFSKEGDERIEESVKDFQTAVEEMNKVTKEHNTSMQSYQTNLSQYIEEQRKKREEFKQKQESLNSQITQLNEKIQSQTQELESLQNDQPTEEPIIIDEIEGIDWAALAQALDPSNTDSPAGPPPPSTE